ncbi:methyltransferase domain-containing protein [Rhizobium sp. CRIBSB]|nr:methyltransferase domain-containing protein [Rhizobium sp. CRIBSB]
MPHDPSHGWNAVAAAFMDARSDVGTDVVRHWARQLPVGGQVVDIGCGTGWPVAAALMADGFAISGIDASPVLVSEFRRRLPLAEVACEPAQTSPLFHRTFDGAVAIGLMFLLPPADQRQIILGVGGALRPAGRFLFTAPRQPCSWSDRLTGRASVSLGEDAYGRLLAEAGMTLCGHHTDAGDNHYFEAVRIAG